MQSILPTYHERLKALKCIVAIPTYNNATTLAKVIADVKEFASDIVVINDGSTDQTSEILAKISDIRVIEYAKNRGKGFAVKNALKKALEWGFDYVLTLDSDGQHFASDIPFFIEKMEQTPDFFWVGARNLAAENMPSKNSFANKFSNFWYKVETGKTLADTQSGFRVYPLKRLSKTRFVTNGYEFEVESIVRATWAGVSVENVPIHVFYAEKGKRISHFRPLRDFSRISLLNTVLCLWAILVYYPWHFVQKLTWENIKQFIKNQIVSSHESNTKLAAAMGLGAFSGILPIWGYQLIFAGVTAHFLHLNKAISIIFSNVSIPPMIPFILYGSMALGAKILGIENVFLLNEISLETIGKSLLQYVLGSIALAILAGIAIFLLAWLLMIICKRKRK